MLFDMCINIQLEREKATYNFLRSCSGGVGMEDHENDHRQLQTSSTELRRLLRILPYHVPNDHKKFSAVKFVCT